MVVQQVETISGSFQVTGEGYAPVGQFLSSDQQRIEPSLEPELSSLTTSGNPL